jgi:type I site-specific restriction endonuclease
MSFNEAETRYYLIDPVLHDKGYDDASKLKLETPAPVEGIGHKGCRRPSGGRTDYLLCVQTSTHPKPLPIGVLEAKKEDADPLKGISKPRAMPNAAVSTFSTCSPPMAIYTVNLIKPPACNMDQTLLKTISLRTPN